MLFSEQSLRYFDQEREKKIKEDLDTNAIKEHEGVINDIKTLNGRSLPENIQPLDMGRNDLPLGYSVSGSLLTTSMIDHPNIIVQGHDDMGGSSYGQWVASSLSSKPDDWLVCVYDTHDDGTKSAWSWIRELRPRNISLSDNFGLDVMRILRELDIRRKLDKKIVESLPNILLIVDSAMGMMESKKPYINLIRLIRDSQGLGIYCMIIDDFFNAELLPSEFRMLFHNNVYFGYVAPAISGFDKNLPADIRITLPRKRGLMSHTSDDGYEVGLIPSVSRKGIMRALDGNCWQ